MNCKHVQDLLPLYVGRDLAEKRAQLVSAHMQSCLECTSLADEYRVTRELVQGFAPPAFSDDVYSEMRENVWREIGRQSHKPSPEQFIVSLFQPRLRWAAATALLLAVSLFAFYFLHQGRNRTQLAESPGGEQQDTRSKQVKALPLSDLPRTTPGSDLNATEGAGSHLTISPRGPRASPAVRRVAQSMRAVRAPRPVEAASYIASETKRTALNTSAPSEKTLRVEIQTNDPNIRIIWFSQQRPDTHSPGESSKGF